MSANRRRGEIAAILDGRERRLCLTLGALAELEAAYSAENLSALAVRFSGGLLSSTDLIRIVGAGLRGAGEPVTDTEVAGMATEGGVAGLARIAADLLAAAFGVTAGEADPQNP